MALVGSHLLPPLVAMEMGQGDGLLTRTTEQTDGVEIGMKGMMSRHKPRVSTASGQLGLVHLILS